MNRERVARIKRFTQAAVIALPTTIALIFLMTRLILPGEQDRIVTRMIQDIEFLRSDTYESPTEILVYERPPPIEEPPPEPPLEPLQTQAAQVVDQPVTEETPPHIVDWWAEARALSEEADEEALQRWLLEQGYRPYVSIMQGALPITNPVEMTLPSSQEDKTGYRNAYGDLEFKISENCIMQTLVSARLDNSDFTRNLPMRVMCKPARKQEFDFERD